MNGKKTKRKIRQKKVIHQLAALNLSLFSYYSPFPFLPRSPRGGGQSGGGFPSPPTYGTVLYCTVTFPRYVHDFVLLLLLVFFHSFVSSSLAASVDATSSPFHSTPLFVFIHHRHHLSVYLYVSRLRPRRQTNRLVVACRRATCHPRHHHRIINGS